MSEEIVQQSGSKYVHVQAQPDHLESLARGKPVNALAELIWNALDADADQVALLHSKYSQYLPQSLQPK